MKKIIAVILAALITAPYVPASANGGPGEGKGKGVIVGGNVSFVNTPDIVAERENLDIKISPYNTVVTAEYTLKNNGPERELGYIFPVTNYLFEHYNNASIEEISFYDNGIKLDSSFAQSQQYEEYDEIKLNDPAFVKALNGQEIYYGGIINNYYFTKLRFAKGETKTLTVTYKADNSYKGWPVNESLFWKYSDMIFLYDLRPAASWGNGKAGEFNLRVDYTELKAARDIKINIGNFQADESGIFTYSSKGFDFAEAGILSIIADYPFEYMVPSEENPRNVFKRIYASPTLPGKDDRYSPKNLFDNNIGTVWASNGNGIGAVIEIEFNADEVNLLVILNGFVRTRELYYGNARIKTLKVERTLSGAYFADEIEFDDIPYEQIYKDAPLMNSTNIRLDGNLVRLTVLDVYPGKKYEDVCISEIYALQKEAYQLPDSESAVSDRPFFDERLNELRQQR